MRLIKTCQGLQSQLPRLPSLMCILSVSFSSQVLDITRSLSGRKLDLPTNRQMNKQTKEQKDKKYLKDNSNNLSLNSFLIQWKQLNVITVNFINWFCWSNDKSQNALVYVNLFLNWFDQCYHSVIVFTLNLQKLITLSTINCICLG